MVGFELSIKDEIIAGALEEGAVTIAVTFTSRELEEPIRLDFGGLDTSKRKNDTIEYVDWFKSGLEVGDVFTIKVKDIDEVSPAVKVREVNNRDELDLKSYHQLKERLEKKGLI